MNEVLFIMENRKKSKWKKWKQKHKKQPVTLKTMNTKGTLLSIFSHFNGENWKEHEDTLITVMVSGTVSRSKSWQVADGKTYKCKTADAFK